MAKVNAPRCSNCHAPLEVAPGATRVRCAYCGIESVVKTAGGGAATAGGAGAPHGMRPAPVRRTRTAGWAVAGAASVLFLGVAVGVWSFVGAAGDPEGPTAATRAAAPSVPKEIITWQRGSAELCSVDGEGNEDLVGLFRLHEDGESRMYAGAFRGTDFSRVWKVGPFGGSDDPNHYSRVSCAGRSVVVADFRGTLHAYDIESGEERWTLSLSDRVERMCAGPGGRELFAEVADGAHRLVDVEVGRGEEAERPSWCPPPPESSIDACSMVENFRGGHARATCRRASRGGDGFHAEYALEESGRRVLVGYKKPGTRTPMAAGAKGGEISWTRVIPRGDIARAAEGAPDAFDLADGQLVLTYEIADEWRLAAFDAATGERLWDQPTGVEAVGSGGTPMTISPCRIYLPQRAALRVFAADTGAYLGGVGTDVSGPGAKPCRLAAPEPEAEPAGERADASAGETPPRGSARDRSPPRERARDPRPEKPDRAAVVRILESFELGGCEGHGTLTYGIRIESDGTAETTSLGPMRTRGPASGCVRSAIEGARFPESREGLELRHEFVVPES